MMTEDPHQRTVLSIGVGVPTGLADYSRTDTSNTTITTDGADDPFFDYVRDVSCTNWHTDRVVLLGDATHAVHPISGMSASLALQDARVLAQELLTTSTASYPATSTRNRLESRITADWPA